MSADPSGPGAAASRGGFRLLPSNVTDIKELKRELFDLFLRIQALGDSSAPSHEGSGSAPPLLELDCLEAVLKSMGLSSAFHDEVEAAFRIMDSNGDGTISFDEFCAFMLKGCRPKPGPQGDDAPANDEGEEEEGNDYKSVHQLEQNILFRALSDRLAIPFFADFCIRVKDIFDSLIADQAGQISTYIPRLQTAGDHFAVSVVTVDGQVLNLGDFQLPFSLQSLHKPFTYGMALEEHGLQVVHSLVGREPHEQQLARAFELYRDEYMRYMPYNPMLNAGAIVCSGLVHPRDSPADRFSHVVQVLASLAGRRKLGFLQEVYLEESSRIEHNRAITHYMHGHGVFRGPLKDTNPMSALQLYVQSCAVEVTSRDVAVMAATLAKSGVCPITQRRCFRSDTVKYVLGSMLSQGFYDFSGEWAMTIGIPGKSGVQGAIMAVVPDVMGICVWSPNLDEFGNSHRAVEFFRSLVSRFSVGLFDRSFDSGRLRVEEPRSEHPPGRADATDDTVQKQQLYQQIFRAQRLLEHGGRIRLCPVIVRALDHMRVSREPAAARTPAATAQSSPLSPRSHFHRSKFCASSLSELLNADRRSIVAGGSPLEEGSSPYFMEANVRPSPAPSPSPSSFSLSEPAGERGAFLAPLERSQQQQQQMIVPLDEEKVVFLDMQNLSDKQCIAALLQAAHHQAPILLDVFKRMPSAGSYSNFSALLRHGDRTESSGEKRPVVLVLRYAHHERPYQQHGIIPKSLQSMQYDVPATLHEGAVLDIEIRLVRSLPPSSSQAPVGTNSDHGPRKAAAASAVSSQSGIWSKGPQWRDPQGDLEWTRIGVISTGNDSLHRIRERICNEIVDAPANFVFLRDGAPLDTRQEQFKLLEFCAVQNQCVYIQAQPAKA